MMEARLALLPVPNEARTAVNTFPIFGQREQKPRWQPDQATAAKACKITNRAEED
jgi:hypothetical protein